MRLTDRFEAVGAVARTGILHPIRPDRLVRMARGAAKWGQTVAAACAVSAARHPDGTAIIDERGRVDCATLDQRTAALATAWSAPAHRLGRESVIGILSRNHRGFVEAMVAAAKVGADVVLLNTGFAGPQLGEVARREGVTALVHDQSFAAVVAASGLDLPRFVAWTAGDDAPDAPTFEALIDRWRDAVTPPAPGRSGNVVILSSGTTGTPKGAKRNIGSDGGPGVRAGISSSLGMITRLPIRSRETTLVAAPLFHTWGLSNFLLCAGFSSPMVLLERFDPEQALAAIERERVGTLVVVPAMLQRILALPEAVRARYDTSSLRLVASSGSALPGGLAPQWMDAFGDHLYSLYGSTEVAAVAIAGPADLRTAPDTAGPIVPGVAVRLLDEEGGEVRPSIGRTGRIFVRSELLFEGYTGGGTKQVVDGFMSTGDVGRFDAHGRLYVEGREDDMIVSGGENVFPQEVEDVILTLPSVRDAAVVGVADPDFGQRLRAVVVAGEPAPTADDVRDHVRRNLARYKVPRDVVFRDELPRNATGKVLRRVLTDEAAEDR
jgi:fatty-acyl-CoA synthase